MSEIKILIIGGSGAYHLPKEDFGRKEDLITVKTPFGQSNPIHIINIDGQQIGFMSRHGESGYEVTAPFVNYRANIWAAKEIGAQKIISWTGPGAISNQFKPGDYVIPDDIIDFTKNRPNTFFEKKGIGFIRQNPVFCPVIRQALLEVKNPLDVNIHSKAVYVCSEGPRLETPAEIRFFKQIGGDLIGMTLVPEAFLAKELEMCYATICYITNYAEGIKELAYQEGVLFEGTLPEKDKQAVEKAVSNLPLMIKKAIANLSSKKEDCPCQKSMLRYKKRGDISDDWHTWF